MSENWDFYPCKVEGEWASVMVNLGLAQEAPIDTLPDCAWLHVTMKNPREDGLSSSAEFDRLCEIGDALDAAFAEASTSLRYVGRCTCGGQRDFYAYAESGLVAESVLSSVMTAFPEYEFETGFREDGDWRLYREFLYPDEGSMELIRNRRVLEALEKAGDALEQPRPVRHFAYFAGADNANQFAEAVIAAGFEIVARNHDEERQRHSVVFERVDSVSFSEINDLTFELRELAKSHGGDYDGWETPVVSSDAAATNDDLAANADNPTRDSAGTDEQP